MAAENTYTSARTASLANLRKTLFDEFRSHVQETDMSVPTQLDGYWYYARTQEGKQYGVQCRMPIRGEDDWTPPEINANDAPGVIPGEQVILDANTEAEGHDFFQIGGMDISKDGTWLLFGVDTSGDEQYDFRIRNLDTGEQLPDESSTGWLRRASRPMAAMCSPRCSTTRSAHMRFAGTRWASRSNAT